jgi:hypothetical protein
MQRNSIGHYGKSVAGGEIVRAFVPNPLLLVPTLDLQGGRQQLLEKTTAALGHLSSISPLLPLAETDPDFADQAVRQIVVMADSLEQFPKRGAILPMLNWAVNLEVTVGEIFRGLAG